MNCRHCVRAVENALRDVPGVTRVERVELESGRVLVAGNADSHQALVAAIKAVGYGAEPVIG